METANKMDNLQLLAVAAKLLDMLYLVMVYEDRLWWTILPKRNGVLWLIAGM